MLPLFKSPMYIRIRSPLWEPHCTYHLALHVPRPLISTPKFLPPKMWWEKLSLCYKLVQSFWVYCLCTSKLLNSTYYCYFGNSTVQQGSDYWKYFKTRNIRQISVWISDLGHDLYTRPFDNQNFSILQIPAKSGNRLITVITCFYFFLLFWPLVLLLWEVLRQEDISGIDSWPWNLELHIGSEILHTRIHTYLGRDKVLIRGHWES